MIYNIDKNNRIAYLKFILEDFEEVDFPLETMTHLNSYLGELKEISIDYTYFDEWLSKQRVKRELDYLVIHTTATIQTAKVSSIVSYWKNNLKWSRPGYHILIKPDGSYSILFDLEYATNGVYGYNQNSIHISYIGGIDENGKPIDNRTDEQKVTLKYISDKLITKYKLEMKGHRDFPKVNKTCPCFDVKTEF